MTTYDDGTYALAQRRIAHLERELAAKDQEITAKDQVIDALKTERAMLMQVVERQSEGAE